MFGTFLQGRLTTDVTLTHTPAGVPVAKFGLAVNKTWTNQDGSKGKKTTFYRCTAWRKTGENIARFFSKGKGIILSGDMENSEPYEDKKSPGTWRASLEMTVTDFVFPLGDGNGNGNGNGNGHEQEEAPAPVAQETEEAPVDADYNF